LVILKDESFFDLVIRASDSITVKYFVHARGSKSHLATIPDFFNEDEFKLLRISDTSSKNPLFHKLKYYPPLGRKLNLLYM